GRVEMVCQLDQELLLGLIVPIGLSDRRADRSGRSVGTAGLVGALLARGQILLLEHFERLQVGKLGVSGVLQYERLGAVAHHHPLAFADRQTGHAFLLNVRATLEQPGTLTFALDQTPGGRLRFAAAQLVPSRRRRAMTCAWISAAPSKMLRMRASHKMREAGNSSAKPLPPWICTALSAFAQATRAASSFAMPASRSQRRPESFSRAA